MQEPRRAGSQDDSKREGQPGAALDEKFSQDLLLEDYRLWLRELEKQDRWIPQSIWTVLAGTAAALALIRQHDDLVERTAAELLVLVVGGLFISMSADFLIGRVNSYLKVSRVVAAVRRSYRMADLLALDPALKLAGAPMISDEPKAFSRTSIAGRRSGFRTLHSLHWFVLALLYGLVGTLVHYDHGNILVTLTLGGIGLIHLVSFTALFRWRASEANDWGEFLVTMARDYRVDVAGDAEKRLAEMVLKSRDEVFMESISKPLEVMREWEDRRFFKHRGIDWISVVAVLSRVRRRGGASTISMQLARQLVRRPHSRLLWPDLKRKVFETALGRWLLRRRGHDWVLEMWVRSVPFGRSDVVGVEHAAKYYFDKQAQELDVMDGLVLAERVTVSRGRFDKARFERFISWAHRRGILDGHEVELARVRYQEAQHRSGVRQSRAR